jgi:DNA-binding response OmpR family regulator
LSNSDAAFYLTRSLSSKFSIDAQHRERHEPAGGAGSGGQPKDIRGDFMRLLFLEDNHRLRTLTAKALGGAGFAVDAFATVRDARDAFASQEYDCLILDLGLPDGDGMELLTLVRQGGSATPVLLLTARDDISSVVHGLNGGADDYLRKPFSNDELIARIRALLRRPGTVLQTVLQQGNIAFDPTERRATVGETVMDLSRREVAALETMMRRPGRVISKTALEETLYGYGEEVSSNAVEVLVHRLRKKLVGAGADCEIHTLRGIGYLFAERPA